MTNKSKKISFIISSLKGGGAERVLSIIANELCNKFNVEIVTFYDQKSDYYINDKIDIKTLSIKPAGKGFLSKLFSFLNRLLYIRRFYQKNQRDIVISFMEGVNISLLMSLLFMRNKPFIIISERNTPWLNLPYTLGSFWGGIVYCLQYFLYQKAQILVVQSDKIKNWASIRWPKLEIVKISNPVFFKNKFRTSVSEKINKYYFLSVGRLEKYKSHVTIIKAFNEIKFKLDNKINLYIVGDGPEDRNLNQLIKSYSLEDRIKIIPRSNDVEEIYLNSNIFIFSSYFEGIPNVILEAMSFSLPIISSDFLAVKELIEHEKSGLIFPKGDYKNLSEMMLKLSKDVYCQREYSSEAYKNLSNFNVSKIGDQWFRLINDI